ncbi:MAG: hypothetical protein WCO42_10145 [bacterium]
MTEEKNNQDPEHRGMAGLTEVLRLQAEALSRISERMAGLPHSTGDTPPQPLVQAGAAAGGGANLPALAGDRALNEDSLPVLNSFKKFLDQERRRGRRRMLWALLGFTLVFASVLAVIVWLSSERVKEIKADIRQTGARLDRSKEAAEFEIQKVASKADQAAARNALAMRSDITRNILWAHSALSSNMTTELSGRDSEIERLKEKVSSLEIDNAMLTGQVTDLAKRVKSIEADYLDFLERRVIENQITEQDAGATNTGSTAIRSGPMTINSARFGRAMQLRVPGQ